MPHAPMNQQYTSPKINQTLGVYTIDFTSVIVNYVVRRMNFFANGFAIILTFLHIFKETQAIHSLFCYDLNNFITKELLHQEITQLEFNSLSALFGY